MYGAVVSGGHLLVVALTVTASLLVLVSVVVLCVCFKKRSKADGLDSGAHLEGSSEAQPSPIEQSNVNPLCTLDEVSAVHRHDVHSTQTVIAANGSVKGQDHRALPALPAVPPVTTPDKPPDDDPDPEGNYDVISGTKKSHSIKQTSVEKPVTNHCYETVADAAAETDQAGLLNTDDIRWIDEPDYAGVDYDDDAASSQVDEAAAEGPAVAQVEVRADAVYAQVDDRRATRNTKTLSADYGVVPPVPVKMFDVDDEAVPRTEHSPSLPPRNGAEMNGHVYATPGEPADRTSVGSSGAGDAGPTMTTGHPPFTPTTDAADGSEPRYSRVTARESLDNLRRRQAASRSLGTPSSRLSVPTDRVSQMSDLYAEISAGSGQSSARSSTYAQVGEESVDTPAPPPVETLKHLSKASENNVETADTVDPGYSLIKYKLSGASEPPRAVSSMMTDSGRRSPVYAVVDKSKKSKARNTVHGDLLSTIGQYDNVDYPALPPALTPSRPATMAVAEPGYQTIGSALGFKVTEEGATSSREGANYDPDYERVSEFEPQPGSREGSRAGSLRGNTRQVASSSSLRKKPWPWLNQEHIYQEINETRLNPPSLSLPSSLTAEGRKSGHTVQITGL